MSNIMLDLETMGTSPYSPVIAIGACVFDLGPVAERAGTYDDGTYQFYQAITLESCLDIGLKPSASTIIWWAQQSAGAQAVLTDPSAVTLPLALDAFTDWLNSRPYTLWGNSASFDCGLLAAAYKACGKEIPWQFYREACYRTVKNLPGAREVELDRYGTHHNALDDAISQAMHLQAIYKKLNLAS
jgi:DNA polymerase III epsilon subunit-like protein